MWLLKVFGALDVYSALVMLLVQFDVVSWRLILTSSAWLIFKSFLFKGDLASMVDLGIGVYHIIMIFLPIPLLTYVLAAHLLIKGAMSFF